MAKGTDPHNLDEVLRAAHEAGDGSSQVSLRHLLDAVGRRSFGPFLVVISIIGLTPLGGIPGVPTILALMVALVAGQLLFGARQFWLPSWLLERTVSSGKLQKAVDVMRPAVRPVDRIARARLQWLVEPPAVRVAALGCILVCLTVPPLELVPFAGTISWAAIAAFGLALIAYDGVLVLVALGFAGGAAYLVGSTLL